MTICGYCYKFNEEIGNSHYKIANDEIITNECERSTVIPVPVLYDFIPDNQFKDVTDLQKMIGTACLRNDEVGIYAEITLFKNRDICKLYRKMDIESIKNNLNMGLSIVAPPPSMLDSLSYPVEGCRINFVILGRFLAPHIYKPDTVYGLIDKEVNKPPKSNADHIRQMTDEELADLLDNSQCSYCAYEEGCDDNAECS